MSLIGEKAKAVKEFNESLAHTMLKIVNIVNDMYVPYLYMPKTKLKTLTTFLMNYAGAQQGSWPTLAAAIIVVLIPTVVLYLIFHKQITEGLSAGATKE